MGTSWVTLAWRDQIRFSTRLSLVFPGSAEAESEHVSFGGAALLMVRDHAAAREMLRRARCEPPPIPPGCNTAEMLFQTADGRWGMAVNEAASMEEPGGCVLIILVSPLMNETQAAVLLNSFLRATE
jgi:hypothetical protein